MNEVVQIQVIIVDDDPLAVSGIEAVLAKAEDIKVIATASDAESAIKLVRKLRPDVVLMDLRMPGMSGTDAISVLLNGIAPPKIISLTTLADDATVLHALAVGSNGYILKDRAPEELVVAINTVLKGQSMLSPQVTTAIIRRGLHHAGNEQIIAAKQAFERLTDRERKVALLISEGLSNTQIAEQLFVSSSTVKTLVNSIFARLDVAGRTQIAVIAAYAAL